ncbi:MAG TPA: glycoside hydrolase family 31 protein [Bacteroidales bacterium]|nr:glycoside hydrolase family 31 protein [Bacteroidales bacterium]
MPENKNGKFNLTVFLSLLLSVFTGSSAMSQEVRLDPENPPVESTVTVYYNAAEGNKSLKDYTGDIYLHTGVITNKSLDGHDWKYVVGNWGTDDKRVLMKREGPNLYSFRMQIRSFYSLRDDDIAQQLAFVFRNADGTLVGKTADNEDITVPVNGYRPAVTGKVERIFKPRKLLSLEETVEGWKIHTDNGIISVRPFSDQIIEVTYYPVDSYTPDKSHSVVAFPGQVVRKTNKTSEGYELESGRIKLSVKGEPFAITYLSSDTLFREECGFYTEVENSGVRFRLANNEIIYGTGERALPMNRRGYRLALYNRPFYGYEMGASMLNYSMPLTFSSKRYALLFDNPQKGYVDIGKTEKDVMEWGTIGGTLRYYVIAGNDWPEISREYTRLTGNQPLPPRWAFGNLQSRMAYRNQQQAEETVDLMLKKKFPMDALILDFYWFGDSIQGHLGKLDWFKPAWPDPVGMISKFKKLGIKTILITEPYIIDTVANYKDADAHGIFVTDSTGNTYLDKQFYFGPGSLIDIFKPEARDWFWQKYDARIKEGVAGWWGDLGEPESHPSDIRHIIGKADEVHNIYGHYWDKFLFDKYAENYPGTRLFHLQRSGFAGTQRYSAFPWTGDVSRSWGGFQAQLPLLLTMSMSGLGYIHSDAGGFAQGVRDDELYTRWLQFAVFTPILRPHGSNHPSEPVYWSEKTQEIVRNYMNLRYAMLPYNYTLAWQNSTTGAPLMRPLFYHFADDTVTFKIQDEYLWGADFLVAPVIEKGLKSRKIYFPEGEWYNLNRDMKYAGNQWIDYTLKLEELPVFIRGGSFIPFTDTISTTDHYDASHYTVWYFPQGKSVFEQYEDDGKDNFSISNNRFEIIRYEGSREDGKTTVTISRKGYWKGMTHKKHITLKIPMMKAPGIVAVQGKNIPEKNRSYDGHWLSIEIMAKKQPVEITITD